MCGNYATIVSNAARDINSDIIVTLSVDGNGFFTEQKESASTDNNFSAQALLSSLMEYFDASSYSGLKCQILIESYETPLDITEQDITDGIDIDKASEEDKFYIEKHDIASSF
jgi:hypothetical protein